MLPRRAGLLMLMACTAVQILTPTQRVCCWAFPQPSVTTRVVHKAGMTSNLYETSHGPSWSHNFIRSYHGNHRHAVNDDRTSLSMIRRRSAAMSPGSTPTGLLVTKVRNMERPVTLVDKVTFVPRWMVWQVIRFITFVQRSLFRAIVTGIAGVVTAIIIDPAVNRAFAHAMKDGLNLFLTQPTIKTKLLEFQENLSNNEPSLAKPIGEDFPKLLFNFLSGLILQGLDGELERENDKEGMIINGDEKVELTS